MFFKESVQKIFQNSQKTPVLSLFFNEVGGLRPATLLKKRLQHRRFPVNFAKFLRAPFFIEHLRWLFLSSINEVEILIATSILTTFNQRHFHRIFFDCCYVFCFIEWSAR